MYKDFKLLVDGTNAFPEIINCIENAKKSIDVNMFIWRNDNIGNLLANKLIEAANRGVKVYISIDRYGLVLEYAEEYRESFFHEKPSFYEKLSVKALEILYPKLHIKRKRNIDISDLAREMLNHENIIISRDELKKDHSKYWIFDDEIIIFGGINVEDKENGCDISGRYYQDYMIKMNGVKYVENFKLKLNSFTNGDEDYYFGINYPKCYEMDDLYLDMINNSQKELLITMPYFTPLKRYLKAIISAYKRGVNITIMVPEKANFQTDTNFKTVRKIMKKCDNNINVYLSPKMVHTKMIINEEYISMGSTNITNKTFNVLRELNLFVKNVDCDFTKELFKSIGENQVISKKIYSYKVLRYNLLIVFLESFVV